MVKMSKGRPFTKAKPIVATEVAIASLEVAFVAQSLSCISNAVENIMSDEKYFYIMLFRL